MFKSTLALLVLLGSAFIPSAALAQSYRFPRVGGVRVGAIEYLKAQSRPDRALENSIRQTEAYQDFLRGFGRHGNNYYAYMKVDINNDGREDAFVNHCFGNGSGGDHIGIFLATPNGGYKLLNVMFHTAVFVVTPRSTNGFRDLIHASGKVGFHPDYYYDWFQFSSPGYTSRELPPGSIITGKVGYTSRQLPPGSIITGKVIYWNFDSQPKHPI